MKGFVNDINIMISKIKEYNDNQDGAKYEYVVKKYKEISKRANEVGLNYNGIENTIPTIPCDAYDIITNELEIIRGEVRNIIENSVDDKVDNTERVLINYIKKNNGIDTTFGKIDIIVLDKIGQGGNGCVYLGKINGIEIAIKFLVGYNDKKLIRFKSEYFNINIVRDKITNIVNNIYYGELKVGTTSFPYIIMKKYKCSLKEYRLKKEQIEWKDVEKLFEFLTKILKSIHEVGIIHRDIKPENILVDEDENYFMADFGIAHFDNENFPIDNKTKSNERLANFEFSAPEQINSKFKCVPATDIYSMAQIIYWFVFKEVHRGTGIKNFQEKFNEKSTVIFSNIINKCLQNDIKDRYQSIDEIDVYIKSTTRSLYKEYDLFEDMFKFNEILCSINPDFYNGVSYIDDRQQMIDLFEKLNSAEFEKEIEFNTGKSNNTVKRFYAIENGNFKLDHREITIKRIWGSVSSNVYDDICILELVPSKSYKIDDEEYYGVAVINGEKIIPVDKLESGYVKLDGKVVETKDLRIEERYIMNDYKYMMLGTFYQCSIIQKNNTYIEKLQQNKELNKEIIRELKRKISKNKASDVSMRL